ncbi:hypothetical protein V8G54_007267 [Vigna mungo]|uniref:Stomatal closure-related actin-binding protein coiled-coil domain-containing protein n=1 Tax=Vigna mungo TaxID=3915 RepID=A0AAQ3P2Z4_VIGMU
MEVYREMFTYIKSALTRNYREKCINNITDYVSGSTSQNFGLLQEFYQTTLKALEEAKNEYNTFRHYLWLVRLWFKTNLKLCKIFFDIGEYGRMSKILKELHKSCQREDGTDDHKKGTQLLEARLREAASLEKHVLLKKLTDALESLKGCVAGRNKDDVEEAIVMVRMLLLESWRA